MNEIREISIPGKYIICRKDLKPVLIDICSTSDIDREPIHGNRIPTYLLDTFEIIIGILKLKNRKAFLYVKKSEYVGETIINNKNVLYRSKIVKIYKILNVRYIIEENCNHDNEEEFKNEIKKIASFIKNNNFYYADDCIDDERFKWNKILIDNLNDAVDKNINMYSFIFSENSSMPQNLLKNVVDNESEYISSEYNSQLVNTNKDWCERNYLFSDDESWSSDSAESESKEKNIANDNFNSYLFGGFFDTKITDDKKFRIEILSLISTEKIGPRFLCRGVNDFGHVSFFVQTHVKIYKRENNDSIFDITLLRGSIPLFWYQDKNPMRKQLKYSREDEVSANAFKKHFFNLKNQYLKHEIVVLTLLSKFQNDEKELTDKYRYFLDKNNIKYIDFDFNRYTNDYKNLKKLLFDEIDYVKKQFDGRDIIFRVSCLDCLDRTNLAQYIIAENILIDKLKGVYTVNILEKLKFLFVENGHVLSNFYSGTDSLKSELSLKEKRSIGGFIDDLVINANRLISGKFTDEAKEDIINKILQKNKVENNRKTHVPFDDENAHSIHGAVGINDIDTGFDNINLNISETFSHSLESKTNGRVTSVIIINWCVNGVKCEDILDFEIDVDKNTDFFVISLQKISTSYKKLLFDEKQTERKNWLMFFEKKVANLLPDFVLLSQNFTHDIGILLFSNKNISKHITGIQTNKFKQTFFNRNVSVQTSLNYKNKHIIFTNGKFYIKAKDLEKKGTGLLENHLDKSIYTPSFSNQNYSFISGYFDSPLNISIEELQKYSRILEYDKIYSKDFLYNHIQEIFPSFYEAEITFSPCGDFNKKINNMMYSSRILHSKSIKPIKYGDILHYETGHKPTIGKFFLI